MRRPGAGPLHRSINGHQTAINRTKSFYDELGLEINQSKRKVMIFNGRGLKLPEHQFYIGNIHVEVVDTDQYLGMKLKPSGSMQFEVKELNDKASQAWFSISKHKRLPVARAFQLFDSLFRPIALYGCGFWIPNLLP